MVCLVWWVCSLVFFIARGVFGCIFVARGVLDFCILYRCCVFGLLWGVVLFCRVCLDFLRFFWCVLYDRGVVLVRRYL